eukprot:2281717-Pyramimonas_sp.AAC.1
MPSLTRVTRDACGQFACPMWAEGALSRVRISRASPHKAPLSQRETGSTSPHKVDGEPLCRAPVPIR